MNQGEPVCGFWHTAVHWSSGEAERGALVVGRHSPTVRWMLLQSIGDIEIFSFLCQCSVGLNVFVSSCNKCMYTTRSAVSHITLHHQNRVLQLWMWQSSVLYVFFTWVRLGSIGLIWVYCGSLVFTWVHLGSLGLTWVYLGLLGFTWKYWIV